MQFNLAGKLLTAVALAFAALQPAQAAIVTQNFSGTVTLAIDIDNLDIRVGDILTGSVTFDADRLTGIGEEFLSPEIDPTLKLAIQLKNFDDFDVTDDVDFPEFPQVGFLNGLVVDLDFEAPFEEDAFFEINGDTFEFTLGGAVIIAGNLNFGAVPEPGTLALFGLGLAGIGLLRRRRA